MKNRKGFTIVELVIVIAVIAILAAVLIPTFSGVIQRANESAAVQEARAALSGVIAMSKTGVVKEGTAFVSGDYTFFYKNNSLDSNNEGTIDTTPAAIAVNNDAFFELVNEEYVKGFKSDADAKKVFETLGYKCATTFASSLISGNTYKDGGYTPNANAIKAYAVQNGSENVYIYIPTEDVYDGTSSSAKLLMAQGNAYVVSTQLSVNPTTLGEGATSFQLLYNSDFSKNIIVVIPD